MLTGAKDDKGQITWAIHIRMGTSKVQIYRDKQQTRVRGYGNWPLASPEEQVGSLVSV
jgi:hypothetical protein